MSNSTTLSPLLIDAKSTAKLLSIGKTKLYELHTSGRLPSPIRLGRSIRWNADELRDWTAAGCPERARWQTMRGTRR